MGLSVTFKHVKQIGPGRYEYRRRVPEAVKQSLGQGEFKRVFEAASPSALAKEHTRIAAEFDLMVSRQRAAQDPSRRTPRETAESDRVEALRLLAGASGFEDEDDARQTVAEALAHEGASRSLYMEVIAPGRELPKQTLEDARKLYLAERLRGGEGPENREGRVRLDRVFGRVEKALGRKVVLTLPLTELKREHARKVRDLMLATPRNGGGTLSPTSVRRELSILSAVVNYGLTEFDLKNQATNPFEGLPVIGEVGPGNAEIEKRDPLPDDIIKAMGGRLTGDLKLIWRLLAGTGCRVGEVTGLRVEDVEVGEGSIPYIHVTWHEGRRLKTKASRRYVPLVGDARAAAEEALEAVRGETILFPRYARERGADAASAILMKHLRKITTNRRHVVHSLRHSMKDKLRLTGADKVVQDLILGHASTSIGEIYGSEKARLEVAHKALLKVAGGS